MNTQDKNLAMVIKELHKAFDCFNKEFYNNELPKVIITIQSRGKRNALGWFTKGKVWDDGKQEKHEINISAEYANRDFMEIMKTLHHEMIHLYCAVNDIKNTSRGGTYHNANFKRVSEEHGFHYPQGTIDKKYGWAFSELTEETIEKIKSFGLNEELFSLKRYDFNAVDSKDNQKKKSNIIKWQCSCGVIIRSSKDGLNIICGDCGTKFEKQEDTSEDNNDNEDTDGDDE